MLFSAQVFNEPSRVSVPYGVFNSCLMLIVHLAQALTEVAMPFVVAVCSRRRLEVGN